MLRLVAKTLLVLSAVQFSAAQSTWVTLAGQVTDPIGTGIPGAQVKVESVGGHVIRHLSTDSRGEFLATFLPPGSYSVAASANGFRERRLEGIAAASGDAPRLTIQLPIRELSEQVTVSASSEQLATDGASRSSEFTAASLQHLPITGHQVFNVLSLAPGVLFAQQQFGAGGYEAPLNWAQDGQYVINGGLPETNQFLLNNAPISMIGRWLIAPSAEAVEDVRVLTNTYDAQYGRSGGGTVATTLRSGGNAWHGEGYEFFQNAVFDANSWTNNLEGIGRGKHIAHQYGATFGGPLRKDKDFLFLSLDNYWETTPNPVVSGTPPRLLRTGQDFQQFGITIYNPYSAVPCDTKGCLSPFVRSPFPNDVIPASLISPVALKILSLYPAPNLRALNGNYVAQGSQGGFRDIQPIVRWDHSFSDRDRLYATFAMDSNSQAQGVNGFPGAADYGGEVARLSQHYIVDWTRVISPETIWDVRLSFGRFTVQGAENDCSTCGVTAAQLGIDLTGAPTVRTDFAPHIDLSPYSSIIGNSLSWATENQLDLSPSVTRTFGRHVLHMGGEAALQSIGINKPGRADGELSFDGSSTQQYVSRNLGYGDGSSVADLLLGLPSTGFVDYDPSIDRRWPYFAIYAQDNWKIRSNLSLNLGLRYDVQVPYRELNNQLDTGFDPTALNPASQSILNMWNADAAAWNKANPAIPYPAAPAAILGGVQFPSGGTKAAFRTDWTDVQPRVGVAWNFMPKTVLRAGAGIFYQTFAEGTGDEGFSRRTDYQRFDQNFQPLAASSTGPYSLSDPFPNGILTPQGASSGLWAGLGDSLVTYQRNVPLPRTYEYSFGIQRELPWLLLFEADYVGSQTVHGPMAANLSSALNNFQVRSAADVAYLDTYVTNPFYGVLPVGSTLGTFPNVPLSALLRPFPQFNGVSVANFPVAKYRYDSLQIQMEKRVLDVAPAGIFSFILSYTFSKSFSSDHLLNPGNLREEPIHELSAFDRPHTIGVAGTWDLPFGWGRRYFNKVNSIAAALINGWSADWLYTFQSGVPISAPNATFVCSSLIPQGGQTNSQWFNASPRCWIPLSEWQYRTTPDILPGIRTPANGQLNMSVGKTFWFSDRTSLQVRGEAYNVTNSPVFAAPSVNLTDPRFGQLPLTQSNFPRYIDIGARFQF